MHIKVFLMLIFFLPTLSTASELHLVINGKSYHFDRSQDWNENNYGIGFEYNFEPWSNWIPLVSGSSFKDSFKQTSVYLGAGAKRRYLLGKDPQGMHFDVGAAAFLMRRKDYKDNNPFLGVLPFVSLGNEHVALNATYIPNVSPKFASLLYFQLMIKLANL